MPGFCRALRGHGRSGGSGEGRRTGRGPGRQAGCSRRQGRGDRGVPQRVQRDGLSHPSVLPRKHRTSGPPRVGATEPTSRLASSGGTGRSPQPWVLAIDQLETDTAAAWVVEQPDPVAEKHGRDVRSISSIRPRSSSCRPIVAEKTSRFLPPAASSPIRTASATSPVRKVTPSARGASSGWCVRTNVATRGRRSR